jgi:serine/threonine protein kinase
VTGLVGQQFGNYQLIRLIGEGGFAEVYLGEHIYLGTQAAIKVLYTQLTSDDVDKFRTEARTIARLIHPHIVRVLDFGVERKTPFLVMDYAPNGTLHLRSLESPRHSCGG